MITTQMTAPHRAVRAVSRAMAMDQLAEGIAQWNRDGGRL